MRGGRGIPKGAFQHNDIFSKPHLFATTFPPAKVFVLFIRGCGVVRVVGRVVGLRLRVDDDDIAKGVLFREGILEASWGILQGGRGGSGRKGLLQVRRGREVRGVRGAKTILQPDSSSTSSHLRSGRPTPPPPGRTRSARHLCFNFGITTVRIGALRGLQYLTTHLALLGPKRVVEGALGALLELEGRRRTLSRILCGLPNPFGHDTFQNLGGEKSCANGKGGEKLSR